MGHTKVQKCYILLNNQSKKFFVNRDVVFKEDVFPFGQVSTSHTTNINHSSILVGCHLEEGEAMTFYEETQSIPVELASDIPIRSNKNIDSLIPIESGPSVAPLVTILPCRRTARTSKQPT